MQHLSGPKISLSQAEGASREIRFAQPSSLKAAIPYAAFSGTLCRLSGYRVATSCPPRRRLSLHRPRAKGPYEGLTKKELEEECAKLGIPGYGRPSRPSMLVFTPSILQD